ncbi:hypothetical protein [Actinoplanes subglobosus]|uniref:CdiI immunity protein domain-containing protein n=1 Tax=Actinoplanes subglobosus TaxID=1547892 RepID=A0ABV8J5S6_9ACTN
MDERQRTAGFLAIRRMCGPLLSLPMPPSWGVPRESVEFLTRVPADLADTRWFDRYRRCVTSVTSLFDGTELDPDLIEEFQLELLAAMDMFASGDTGYPVRIAAELSAYLDEVAGTSFAERDAELAALCASSPVTPELVARCDAFGADLVTALRAAGQ